MSSSRYWQGRPTLPSFEIVLSRSRNVSPDTVSVRPYASANHADGNVARKRSMNGIGIFSPPAMIRRTDERSRSATPGTSRIARTIAGAVHTHGDARPFDLVDDAFGVERTVDDRGCTDRDHRGGDEIERAHVVERPAREPDVGHR